MKDELRKTRILGVGKNSFEKAITLGSNFVRAIVKIPYIVIKEKATLSTLGDKRDKLRWGVAVALEAARILNPW